MDRGSKSYKTLFHYLNFPQVKYLSLLIIAALFLAGCGASSGTSFAEQDNEDNDDGLSNIVFVTSVTGTGDLGSWPDAAGKTGPEAADAICQARADAAGLKGSFVAWLSDYNDDAYCRVHKLKGTKFTNCGQSELPVNAGPWIRTDGHPFGGTIDQLVFPNGRLYVPVGYDEFGNHLGNRSYFTATSIDGGSKTANLPNLTCSNWTSSYVPGRSNYVFVGTANTTNLGWTSAGNASCSSLQSLLCFEAGSGPDLPDFGSEGKKVFITSVSGPGNFSLWSDAGGKAGLDAADSICQARAVSAGLTGNFKAWLSNSTVNAVDRFASDGPWVRVDGVKVADDKSDLTDGSIFTSISVDENGELASRWSHVYTGTGFDGIKTSNTCDDWTITSLWEADMGVSHYTNSNWTNITTSHCGGGYLYCFED